MDQPPQVTFEEILKEFQAIIGQLALEATIAKIQVRKLLEAGKEKPNGTHMESSPSQR